MLYFFNSLQKAAQCSSRFSVELGRSTLFTTLILIFKPVQSLVQEKHYLR